MKITSPGHNPDRDRKFFEESNGLVLMLVMAHVRASPRLLAVATQCPGAQREKRPHQLRFHSPGFATSAKVNKK